MEEWRWWVMMGPILIHQFDLVIGLKSHILDIDLYFMPPPMCIIDIMLLSTVLLLVGASYWTVEQNAKKVI